VSAAALLGCEGWILGQQLGCVACGILGECDDIKRDLAPLIPVLAKLLNEVQASPEINLAAKIALDTAIAVHPGNDEQANANAYFLAGKLDDAGLLAVMAEGPTRDDREIIPVPNTIPYDRHEYPADFHGFPDILPACPFDPSFGTAPAPAPAAAPPVAAPPSPTPSVASRSVVSKAEFSVASSGFDSNSLYSI